MIRINGVKTSVRNELNDEFLKKLVGERVKRKIKSVRLFRKSIDARNRENIIYNLTLDFECDGEKALLKRKSISPIKEVNYIIKKARSTKRPVVIGFGPGGMMSGLYFAEAGLKPVILERGKDADSRKADVDGFFGGGGLNKESNVCFGEGGAGTFSDGKLNTGVNDPRIRYILKRFVEFGAPEDILYNAKPHVGTDRLIEVVKNIRKRIEALGGEVRFGAKAEDILIKNGAVWGVSAGNEIFEADKVVLATGHSARDTFEMLFAKGFVMEKKGFSVGVRIEHSQEFINKAQYGDFAEFLPAADYKLFTHLEDGRGVYSFCMCPGGVVVAAATEDGGIVTNGMSNHGRSGNNANSAILVSIMPKDFKGDSPLEGVLFQRTLERKAYKLGGGGFVAPAQNVEDFLADRGTARLKNITPTYRPGVVGADFKELFPPYIYRSLQQGLIRFDKMLHGFGSNAVMTGVESRSTSPVRILRDRETLEAVGVKGVYPCGEGAGYAGGIMSACADGLKCGEKAAASMD